MGEWLMAVHGGRIFDLAHAASVLDFSANINPFGAPGKALDAAAQALREHATHYPDADARALRRALGDWTHISPEHIAVGNGASDLLLPVYLGMRPKRLVIPVPTFSEYAAFAAMLPIPVQNVSLDPATAFAPSLELFERTLQEGDLLVCCQPNNPTGRAWQEEELRFLLALCAERHAHLMVDECFLHLTWPAAFTLAAVPWPVNLLCLRAFTKDFAAPGLRIGYLMGNPSFIAAVREKQQPWPVNVAAEAFAIACMKLGDSYLDQMRREIALLRETLTKGLKSLGFSPFSAAANFLLTPTPLPGSELQRLLLPERLLIRCCNSFEELDDGYIRLAVRKQEENERLIRALASIIQKQGLLPGGPHGKN